MTRADALRFEDVYLFSLGSIDQQALTRTRMIREKIEKKARRNEAFDSMAYVCLLPLLVASGPTVGNLFSKPDLINSSREPLRRLLDDVNGLSLR